MTEIINKSADKILDMDPDPIPRFVLLKEFKGAASDNREYLSLYNKVCNHRYVKSYETAQNERGFWQPFHGYT